MYSEALRRPFHTRNPPGYRESKLETEYKRRHRTKTIKCNCCGEVIKGKRWRVSEGVYECTRCHNQSGG